MPTWAKRPRPWWLRRFVGGDSIDNADVLRSGRAGELLGTWVPAPSTLGTFLRSFSFGDAGSLDKVAGELLKRAWASGRGGATRPSRSTSTPASARPTARKKERARFGYTSVRGPQPAPGDSRRQRGSTGRAPKKGSAHTARGAAIFLAEVFNRVRATGASGELTLWADSGFHNHKVIKACQKAGVHYSITAKLYGPMSNAIEAVPPERWARRLLGRRRRRRGQTYLPALRPGRRSALHSAPGEAVAGEPAGAIRHLRVPPFHHRPGRPDAPPRG